jgi:exopolysaccharide production protein ExoQ
MPSVLALCIFSVFILWLFLVDRKRCSTLSTALWIPAVWVMILMSKNVSLWFNLGGVGSATSTADALADGSALDRLILLLMEVAGFLILWTRNVNWLRVINANKCLTIFYVYWGISLIWSDYPFVSFKRWIKDLGNVIMVLVILTERDPIGAIRTVFARCTYLLIPLSVLFIKYYSDSGRIYDRWTGQVMYVGVTSQKNSLGALVLVCALFQIADLLKIRDRRPRTFNWGEVLPHFILLLMMIWLLTMAHSATSLVCTLLGISILLGMRFGAIRKNTKRLELHVFAGVLLLVFLQVFFNIGEVFLQILGRSMTLTDRTDIWQMLLSMKTNPLVGVGFSSFWLGKRAEAVWDQFPGIMQSHNGYLEVYLNGGLLGVCLLILVLASTGRTVRRELLKGTSYGALRYMFFILVIVFNFTEAVFNRFSHIWFVFILVAMEYPRLHRLGSRTAVERSAGRFDRDETGRKRLVVPQITTSP